MVIFYNLRMDQMVWVVANWKCNKSIQEATDWVLEVGSSIPKSAALKVVVCSPYSCLSELRKVIEEKQFPLLLGSQNLSPFQTGSYTGEEAAQLLAPLIDISIIGHSERRTHFLETDEVISEKLRRADESNILPILCVQDENTPIPPSVEVVAYEPVFAIGTGTPDTPENANTVSGEIRRKNAKLKTVLYGGSVNSANVASFIKMDNISGVLVGSASLNSDEFTKIVNCCQIFS